MDTMNGHHIFCASTPKQEIGHAAKVASVAHVWVEVETWRMWDRTSSWRSFDSRTAYLSMCLLTPNNASSRKKCSRRFVRYGELLEHANRSVERPTSCKRV